jgi:uncharacterized protein
MKRKISVKVVPNARKNSIEQKNSEMKVCVTAKAEDNKANLAVIELLSDYFSVKKSCVRILAGAKSRKKIVEITE